MPTSQHSIPTNLNKTPPAPTDHTLNPLSLSPLLAQSTIAGCKPAQTPPSIVTQSYAVHACTASVPNMASVTTDQCDMTIKKLALLFQQVLQQSTAAQSDRWFARSSFCS